MSAATRRSIAACLLLLAILAGCASSAPPAPSLAWEGHALTGASFTAMADGQIILHAEASLGRETTDQVLARAVAEAIQLRDTGRIDYVDRLQIWLIPDGAGWPRGVAEPPPGRQARAAGPDAVLLRWSGEGSLEGAGLEQAMAIAATQAKKSPAYAVDWIHEGMGSILQNGDYGKMTTAFGDESPWTRLGQLAAADDPKTWQQAAFELAGAVVDRFGIAWTVHFPRSPEELTPSAALQWAMNAKDENTAIRRWVERTQYIEEIKGLRPNMSWFITAADMSPIRLQPKLNALPVGPGPNENYSPHSYDIDVRYEPERRTVAGTLKLTWQNGEGIPVDQLYFNLWPNAEQFAAWGGAMTIESVIVDSGASNFVARGLDLAVPLGRQVEPGHRTDVVIQFTTNVPLLFQRPFGQMGLNRFYLSHWFPTLAVLDDRGWILHALTTRNSEPYAETAHYKVRLDVPKGFLVGATGVQTARRTEGDRWIYEYDAPDVRDWVANGGTELIELVRDVDGIRVRVLERNEPLAKQTADEVEKAMRILNERFGRYAWAELGVSCCIGMEYAGYIYTEDAEKVPHERYLYVVYHELAHEWFYGMVGNDQYNEPWLDEGFNTYADRVVHRTLGLEMPDLEPYRNYPVHVSASQYDYTPWQNMINAYYGGALVLEDLEAELGTPVMQGLMKEWVRRNRFKVATTPEFIRFAEEFTGQELDEFFRARGVYVEDRQPYRTILPPGKMRPHLLPPPITIR